jgi:hypothetical protein
MNLSTIKCNSIHKLSFTPNFSNQSLNAVPARHPAVLDASILEQNAEVDESKTQPTQPTPAKQLEGIRSLLNYEKIPVEEETYFFIISIEWYRCWFNYVKGNKKIYPGPISNFFLVSSKSEAYVDNNSRRCILREKLHIDIDYTLILPDMWYALHA